MVKDGRQARVSSVVEKEERKPRPAGLNTVEMLKVASSSLNIGPAHAMQIAERLYTQVGPALRVTYGIAQQHLCDGLIYLGQEFLQKYRE